MFAKILFKNNQNKSKLATLEKKQENINRRQIFVFYTKVTLEKL